MYIWQVINDQHAIGFELGSEGAIKARLSECPTEGQGIFLLPGEKVVSRQVHLPKVKRQALKSAIPYALEESLATDPEEMSVVVGDRQADGSVAAFLFETRWMQSLLSQWKAKEFQIEGVLPDYLALPIKAGCWTVAKDGERALVRTAWQSGFVCDLENIEMMIKAIFSEGKIERPKEIHCYQVDLEKLRDTLGVEINQYNEREEVPFDFSQLSQVLPVNLLPNRYRSGKKSTNLRKRWIICGGVFAAWIAFLFFSKVAIVFVYDHQASVLEKKTLAIYRQIFPGAQTMLEPRFRVREKLTRLKQRAAGGHFFQLLSHAGRIVRQDSAVAIQSIVYDKKGLVFSVNAKNLGDLSRLTNTLHQAGFHVNQQVSVKNSQGIEATLSVEELK